ncbi:MAG: NAD(P)H-binding protein [Puia sp.]|nr:NAD(P)H-binding protein [Puia sp.]
MKYVLTGSLGNITKPLTEKLVAAGHDVTVISSHPEREAAITKLGAKAAIGSVGDAGFLSRTFKGADAVYTMVPPNFTTPDWKAYIRGMGKIYAAAIQSSGVKKVVNLSSIGAQLAEGCGPVSGIHFVELELNNLAGVDILHLRPAFFYTNLYSSIGLIKTAGFYGNNYGAETTVVLTHPDDIAGTAAKELLALDFTGKSILYIASDERDSREIAAVLGAAIGKPGLAYVEFKDEDALKGAVQAGLPEDVAANFVEMGSSLRSGKMIADYKKHPVSLSKTKLEDFAKEFAIAYKNS